MISSPPDRGPAWPLRRQAATTLLVVAVLSLTPTGFTTSAAGQDTPPSPYPETGPTTTTTLPPPVDPSPYPTVPVPTTSPYPATGPDDLPPTTTLAPTPTTPPATVPPDPTPPEPDPEPEPEPEPEPATTVQVYGIANEHEQLRLDISQPDADDHELITARNGVAVSPGGLLTWRPTETDGGTVVDLLAVARGDGPSRTVQIRILVAETNSPPSLIATAPPRAYPGKTMTFTVTATDEDRPDLQSIDSWTASGAPGLAVDGGRVTWRVPDGQDPGPTSITIRATDDGDPAATGTVTVAVDVVDISEAGINAVDANGDPVNPLVIGGAGEPILVDLDRPSVLTAVLADRTPSAVDASPSESAPLQRQIVLANVRQSFEALLELEVPRGAVAGGLAWQFVVMFAPSFLSRRRELVDVTGVEAGAMIGDGTWFFRSDAIALNAGPRRWRAGQWMRRVDSPVGPVWLPNTNLVPSRRR